MKLGDQVKAWAPHMVCKSYTECLRQWSKGKKITLKFGIPMVWREPKNHVSDCYSYFCAIDVTGINRKNRKILKYPDLESARRPVAHFDKCPVPVYAMLPDDNDNGSTAAQEDEEADFSDNTPHPFCQNELNDLVCDLDLSKSSAELLAFRLKEKTSCLMAHASLLIATDIKSSFISFLKKKIWFTAQILFIFCKSLGVPHCKSRDWRLFIDSCKRSFKCVVLHNGNQFAPVPLAHSTSLKEKYDSVKYVLEKISYSQYEWHICVDLKMVNFLLGQQSGFT